MFAPLVNQRHHLSVIQIIQTATDQRKSLTGKVHNCRRKIEPRIEPGFYGMLVGGSDVGEMVCHQRTDMTCNKLRREKLIGSRSLQSGHQVQSDDRSENDRRGETEPIPWCPQKNGPQLWLPSSEQHLRISHNLARGRFGNLFSQRGLNSLT